MFCLIFILVVFGTCNHCSIYDFSMSLLCPGSWAKGHGKSSNEETYFGLWRSQSSARINHDLNYWLMNTLIRRLHANFLAAWNRPASRDSQSAEKDHRSLKSLLLTEKCDCKRLTRWKWKEVPGGAEHLNTSHLKALSQSPNNALFRYVCLCPGTKSHS